MTPPNAPPDAAPTPARVDADRAVGERAEAERRAWVRLAVIGLGLCPFAGAVEGRGQVRYVVSDATDAEALLATLCAEMRRLAAADPAEIETTLLIHPHVLADFDDYNDFLDVADAALEELDLVGVLQVASFHPDYRFADAAIDDVTNATNRSPHPILQLLREPSVERAVDGSDDAADAIVEANLQTMTALGWAGWDRLRARCRQAASTSALPDVGAAATQPTGGSSVPAVGTASAPSAGAAAAMPVGATSASPGER